MTKGKTAAANGGFKTLAVQWLNEVQLSNETFVVTDSLVLRNHQLRVAAKRLTVSIQLAA